MAFGWHPVAFGMFFVPDIPNGKLEMNLSTTMLVAALVTYAFISTAMVAMLFEKGDEDDRYGRTTCRS